MSPSSSGKAAESLGDKRPTKLSGSIDLNLLADRDNNLLTGETDPASNESKIDTSKSEERSAVSNCPTTFTNSESTDSEEDSDYDPTKSVKIVKDDSDSDDDDDNNDKRYESLNAADTVPVLVRTRQQRLQEDDKQAESKAQSESTLSKSTIDDIWASMNATPSSNSANDMTKASTIAITDASRSNGTVKSENNATGVEQVDTQLMQQAPSTQAAQQSLKQETVVIDQKFIFADKKVVRKIEVPRDSAEAKAFLALKSDTNGLNTVKEESSIAVSSRTSQVRARKRPSPLDLEAKAQRAKKLNTLEKSKLDWAQFVDREGIHDDLTQRNKDGYIERQSFLDRVYQKQLSDIKSARKHQN